jgi:hypothetical protein
MKVCNYNDGSSSTISNWCDYSLSPWEREGVRAVISIFDIRNYFFGVTDDGVAQR